MYFGASLLMYFGSEPQRCITLGAIWIFAPIFAIYMRNFAYFCINGLDSYVCT